MGILIEHYAGRLPLWLSPVQAVVASISAEAETYAREVLSQLESVGIHAELDVRSDKIGYKVREHSLKKVPYIAVVGKKESESNQVSVRAFGSDKEDSMKLADFIKKLQKETT